MSTASPSAPPLLKVVIATPSARMGTALADLFSDQASVSVAVEVGEFPSILQAVAVVQPDVVLLDLEPWPELIVGPVEALKKCAPSPVVLALVHGLDGNLEQRCRRAGIDELFDRTADLIRLLDVVAAHARRHGREGRP